MTMEQINRLAELIEQIYSDGGLSGADKVEYQALLDQNQREDNTREWEQ